MDSADQQERINEQALITFHEAGFFRESVEANQARQNGREANRWMVPV